MEEFEVNGSELDSKKLGTQRLSNCYRLKTLDVSYLVKTGEQVKVEFAMLRFFRQCLHVC